LARQEPFRALLDKAMQAEVPTPRRRLPVASPALAIDDEHKRPTLEQRLDAAVLAAGATPPAGIKVPKSKVLVPLRLDAPTAPARASEAVDRATPAPRMLQFLLDDATRVGGEDSVSRIPRRAPVDDTGKVPGRFGIRTNVYRLDTSASDPGLASRPLPLADDEHITVVGRPVSKVMTVLTAVADNVSISSFSFDADDDDIDRTDEGGHISRAPRAAAAVALHALSDEGSDDFDGTDGVDITNAHLDELARQLGLTGLAVPRSTSPRSIDDSSADVGVDLAALQSALDEPAENSDRSGEAFAALQSELLAEFGDQHDDADDMPPLKATDPMRVARRPVVALRDVSVDVDDDGDLLDEFADDEPSNTLRLPASLLSSGFDDDTEVTPPHGTKRLSLEAPEDIRFVVAPARVAPLSADEIARNQGRAHDLYLVALDEIACRDADSAIMHLQLALAYDEDTSLYGDLLAQLEKKAHKRAS